MQSWLSQQASILIEVLTDNQEIGWLPLGFSDEKMALEGRQPTEPWPYKPKY